MKCLIWDYDRLLSQLETKKLLLTDKSSSPSVFPWQQLQHGLHTWSQSRRCGGPNSSALPQDCPTTSLVPCCTAAYLEETQLGYGTHAVQTTTPGNVLSITLCLREEMGMNWLLQLAGWSMSLAFQKESLKTNAQSLKNFCWLQALTHPETLAEICEACVFTLCESELLHPTAEPSLPGTLTGVLESIYVTKIIIYIYREDFPPEVQKLSYKRMTYCNLAFLSRVISLFSESVLY